MPDAQPPAATGVIELNSEQDPVQLDRNRAEMMDFLYRLYRRDQAPAGLRGTYTGLMEQFKSDLAENLTAAMQATWHCEDWSFLTDDFSSPCGDADAPVS